MQPFSSMISFKPRLMVPQGSSNFVESTTWGAPGGSEGLDTPHPMALSRTYPRSDAEMGPSTA